MRASDEDLLRGYRDTGRPEVFAEIHRRYAGELGRYLSRYLGDPLVAEDALQDTFLRVHAKCRLYRDGRPVRPWLYAVATHRAVDTFRRVRRQAAIGLDEPLPRGASGEPRALCGRLVSSDPGPCEHLQARERLRWAHAAVGELPEPLRHVVDLAYVQGLSYSEIVQRLRIPLGTVKSRLHDALSRLRAKAARFERAESG